MKSLRVLYLVPLVALFPDDASAGRRYGMAGCGMGSAVSGRGGSQVSAATTNGTFWSKYLGITSGTSNCNPDRQESALIQQEEFIYSNYNQLSKEMSQGNGSSLLVLSQLMGCGEKELPAFNSLVQQEFKDIFAAPGAIAALERLRGKMSENAELSTRCQFISLNSDVRGAQ
jgi:hypothetical protein